jgi:Z1 domain
MNVSPPPVSRLDQLCHENRYVRLLLQTIRAGRGMTLDAAVNELRPLVSDHAALGDAEEKIRELSRDVQTAKIPRAVVAGNIESWYPGPRAGEDKNWSTLLELLAEDGWDEDSLRDLDESSTKVVANIPEPTGSGEWHCRGLVLGYVQSGKTTNYTAVIAKAADAGYRMFVVLSGIHNALRQQTQDRLNDQLWERHRELWHRLTNEDDFVPTDNVDALLSTSDQRVLMIVKKNGPRLRAFRKWLFGARPELLAACPILVIDDEADQASVNTAKPDRRPTVINGLITQIVNKAPKSAYVGYTATPFANVLLDPKDFEGLYPRDFIIDLPRPTEYIGPEAIFGREPLELDPAGNGSREEEGHDFVRSVPAEEIPALRPKGSSTRHEFEPEVTPSLDAALRYFLLSTAARRIRGTGNRHATALVHTSQHVEVHRKMAHAIRLHASSLATRLETKDPMLLRELEDTWADECERVPAADFDETAVAWADVAAMLPLVAGQIEVITDNSQSEERLQFDDLNPRVVVAVGGNTLSRGLTLEGLSVSFFVRTASAYDTLLQMGRWFGYRHGYADLIRIWMTDEMREWFHHLATVEQEIRFDIERYESQHIKPDVLGVRIRTHPKLAITAAAKMQDATRASASYSGRRLQTILFNHRDAVWLRDNMRAGQQLIESTSRTGTHEIRPGVTAVGKAPVSLMVDFLANYRFHENSRDLDSNLISEYILARQGEGELTHFQVVVMGRRTSRSATAVDLGVMQLGLDEPVGCINRARLKVIGGREYADIKSLMSKTDRAIDLEVDTKELEAMDMGKIALLRNLPSQGGQGDGTGLLLLYPVSKSSVPERSSALTREPLDAVEHVLGVGLVFPDSASTAASVEYVTADIKSMHGVEVDEPVEEDELDEPEIAA